MEQEMKRYYVTNVDTEVTVFQKTQKIAVINNSGKECQTDLYINGDFIVRLTLEPGEMRWLNETMSLLIIYEWYHTVIFYKIKK